MALNTNSRAALVPATTATRLPPSRIVVPGKGPQEPGSGIQADTSKPTPATPVTPTSAVLLDGAEDEHEEDDDIEAVEPDEDEDEQARVGIRSGTTMDDPYANLDSAFGGSSARGTQGRTGPEDDSLI
jgi:hypothetical protein